MACQTCPPLQEIEVNGEWTTPDQIPEVWIREMHGVGHLNPHNRPIVPGEWPHEVAYCRYEEHPTVWQDLDGQWVSTKDMLTGRKEGVTLVCTGCGLDCT